MKILLIFTFFLISGPAACFDVIGYSRGSIIIACNYKGVVTDGYFCKESTNQCVFLESAQRKNSWDHGGRVSLIYFFEYLRVSYKNLSLEDAGSYRCGETGVWNRAVNLNVKTDPCCFGPKTVIGYLGENTTINCSYPEEFQTNTKIFYKLQDQFVATVIRTTDSQNERFSISEDRRSRVISVRISDVTEDDGGVYYCGVWIGGNEVSYLPLFTEIHLQVSVPISPVKPATPAPTYKPPAPTTTPAAPTITPTVPTTTPPAPTTTPPTEPATPTVTTSPPGSSFIIIIVSICVALLLIGGLTLIFFIVILKKRQGSTPFTRTKHSDNKEVPAVVSNDEETGFTTPSPPKDQEHTYSTLTPPKDQELTYSTVSFHKNPGSSTDASVRVSKKEPETEYASIKHPKELE